MKASVVLITYNHVRYIRQAIESILAQETDFDFEILISDDCSTDGTREIVLSYAKGHPDKIRLRLNPVNQNSTEDFEQALLATEGKYVALLEGDDYWTCPSKLQRQVEYLDAHPECSICFHNVQVLQDGLLTGLYNRPSQPEVSQLDDLLKGNFIATGSVMLRRKDIPSFPPWHSTFFCGDFPLLILAAQRGKIGYINEAMGVYRVHPGGVWSSLSSQDQILKIIGLYITILPNLGFRHRLIARREKSKLWYQLAIMRLETGQRRLVFRDLRNTLYDLPCILKLLIYLFTPRLFESMRRRWRRFRLRPT